MKRIAWLILGGVACLLACPIALRAEEDWFPIRAEDEIYLKSGEIKKGRILEGEEKNKVRLRDRQGRTAEWDSSDISKVYKRATPEALLDEYAVRFKGDAVNLVEISRQGLKRFRGNKAVEEKILQMLEQNAAGGDPDLLEIVSERQLAVGNVVGAEAAARNLLGRKSSATAFLLLGRALAAAHKTEEALAALNKAKEQAPDREDVLVALAEVYLDTGRPDEARKIFSDALAKNPRLVGALVGQGYVQLRQGEVVEAAQSFNQVLGADRQHLRANLGLAACKVLRGENDDAYRLCEEVLSVDPKNALAYGLQGYARLMGGAVEKLPQALSKIDDSLKEDPGDTRIWALRAVALNRAAEVDDAAGKPQEGAPKRELAAKLLADVGAANPPDSWLQYLLAELYWEKGETERAAAGFKRAAELAPNYAPAHQAAGAVALSTRQWEAAAKSYARTIELDPNCPDGHAGLGLALLGMKRVEEAQNELRKARDLDALNVPALCGLGYIANFERNELSARTFFQQALAADGRCAYAADALSKMYAQHDLRLDYITFEAGPPAGWSARGGRTVKAAVAAGAVQWKGVQGAAESEKIEYSFPLNADDFARLEADLETRPESAASLGLRIASRAGSTVSFEIELGKDPTGQVAYRCKDYSGLPPEWKPLKPPMPWPKNGRARLGIETGDLNSGVVTLFVNGVNKGDLPLQLKKPGKISVGVFLQAPAKENVDAKADNLALLSRKIKSAEESSHGTGELVVPDAPKEKPAETPKEAPKEKPKEGGK